MKRSLPNPGAPERPVKKLKVEVDEPAFTLANVLKFLQDAEIPESAICFDEDDTKYRPPNCAIYFDSLPPYTNPKFYCELASCKIDRILFGVDRFRRGHRRILDWFKLREAISNFFENSSWNMSDFIKPSSEENLMRENLEELSKERKRVCAVRGSDPIDQEQVLKELDRVDAKYHQHFADDEGHLFYFFDRGPNSDLTGFVNDWDLFKGKLNMVNPNERIPTARLRSLVDVLDWVYFIKKRDYILEYREKQQL